MSEAIAAWVYVSAFIGGLGVIAFFWAFRFFEKWIQRVEDRIEKCEERINAR